MTKNRPYKIPAVFVAISCPNLNQIIESTKRHRRETVAGRYVYHTMPTVNDPRKDSLVNPLPVDKILDRSKLKQSADDNFEFDENSRKFSKRVENTVGKGEIARLEQFLLFPQCFQKACFLGASKGVIVWEWVKRNIMLVTSIFSFLSQTFLPYQKPARVA